MRRIKSGMRFSIQSGLLIALFSVIVAAVFAGFLYFSRHYTVPQSDQSTILYPIDIQPGVWIQESPGQLGDLWLQVGSWMQGGGVQIQPQMITSSAQIYQASVTDFMQRLLPLAMLFCLFVFGAFWLLWLLLERMQQRQLRAITRSVQTLDADVQMFPAFAAAIEEVRRQYQDSLDDYKRLNSYLSHEQKNALAILRTNVELSPNPVYLRNLDELTAGIDDILTLSETQGEEAIGAVDVSLVCATVCDSYRKMTDTITFSFDETANTEVLAKQRWIYRAVSNLVDNAVKYGQGKPIHVAVQARKGSVTVSVQDHGIGIPEEKQELIFANRCRLSEQHSDGYGIGLSLVSHVCDLCGGFVTLESQPGVGTTFYLAFPQLTQD